MPAAISGRSSAQSTCSPNPRSGKSMRATAASVCASSGDAAEDRGVRLPGQDDGHAVGDHLAQPHRSRRGPGRRAGRRPRRYAPPPAGPRRRPRGAAVAAALDTTTCPGSATAMIRAPWLIVRPTGSPSTVVDLACVDAHAHPERQTRGPRLARRAPAGPPPRRRWRRRRIEHRQRPVAGVGQEAAAPRRSTALGDEGAVARNSTLG